MHRRTIIAVLAGSSVTALTGSNGDETEAEPTGVETRTPGGTESDDRPADGSGDEFTPESADESSDRAEPSAADICFELAPYELFRCGTTCAEATTTLTNAGSADATNVRVTVQLLNDGDILWETDEMIGRLEAGSSVTRTERVEVGFGDALALEESDRQVTVTTIIESDQRSERITREKSL